MKDTNTHNEKRETMKVIKKQFSSLDDAIEYAAKLIGITKEEFAEIRKHYDNVGKPFSIMEDGYGEDGQRIYKVDQKVIKSTVANRKFGQIKGLEEPRQKAKEYYITNFT